MTTQQPHAVGQAWGGVAAKLLSGEGPGGVAQQPDEHEAAACPGGQGGQWPPGLHQK